MLDERADTYGRALFSFKALLKRGKGHEEAALAAKDGILSEVWWIRSSSVKHFNALFEANRGYEIAIRTAKKGMASPNWYIRLSAIELFKALLENNRGACEAIRVSSETTQSTCPAKRRSALRLFSTLVKHQKGVSEAIKACGLLNYECSKPEYIQLKSDIERSIKILDSTAKILLKEVSAIITSYAC